MTKTTNNKNRRPGCRCGVTCQCGSGCTCDRAVPSSAASRRTRRSRTAWRRSFRHARDGTPVPRDTQHRAQIIYRGRCSPLRSTNAVTLPFQTTPRRVCSTAGTD